MEATADPQCACHFGHPCLPRGCPSRFSRCVGHGQLQIVSRTVRAAWALERHFNHFAVGSRAVLRWPARFVALALSCELHLYFAVPFRVLFTCVAGLLHIRDIVGRGPKTFTASASTVFPPESSPPCSFLVLSSASSLHIRSLARYLALCLLLRPHPLHPPRIRFHSAV